MIDLHCHILPGIDDGPTRVEESLEMAEQAANDGIETIVATPHTLNNRYFNPPQKIIQNVHDLSLNLSSNSISLTILPGADVHICPGVAEMTANGEVLTINNTGRYVLLEYPYQTIPEGTWNEIFNLKTNGITPIVTHPERNLELVNNEKLIFRMIEAGCLIQLTAMSITGGFGQELMRFSHNLLKSRMAHLIATDAHSINDRPPILSESVKVAARVLGDESEAITMVTERATAIINGEDIDVPEPIRMKRKWWQVF